MLYVLLQYVRVLWSNYCSSRHVSINDISLQSLGEIDDNARNWLMSVYSDHTGFDLKLTERTASRNQRTAR